MSQAIPSQLLAAQRPLLGLYSPPEPVLNVAHWRINGHPAAIVVWTAEEWNRLTDRPTDAQYYPCGIWCALRLE